MAGEHTAFADAAGERLQNIWTEQNDNFASRLAVDNQSGSFGTKALSVALVNLEIVRTAYTADASEEPIFELPFRLKENRSVIKHENEISNQAQRLAAGGQVSKFGSEIQLNLDNGDEVTFDSKNGDIQISSHDRFQKEVQYKGTSWQQTVLTSDKDTRITFTQNSLRSVEHDGIKDVFAPTGTLQNHSKPELPDRSRLNRELNDLGYSSLVRELNEVEKREALAIKKYGNDLHSKAAADVLSLTMKDRSTLLEQASSVLPQESSILNASAENQLRVALAGMREIYGAGTPETKTLALALQNHLKNEHDADNDEEISRLAFEARRGGLLKDIVDNVNKSPDATSQTLPQEQAIPVRKSLITMHILTGDDGLKSFVDDVNKRLRYEDLVAPADQPGPFHHGAIILTPDGATRYGGSFELVPKK